jgi:hypothetical protein
MPNAHSVARALLTYAFVSDSLTKYSDIFMGLTPLFAPYAEISNGRVFNAASFVDWIRQTYNLHITTDVAEYFTSRLVRSSLLVRDAEANDRAIYHWKTVEKTSEQEQLEFDLSSAIDDIGEIFKSYTNKFPSLFTVSLSVSDLLDHLLKWLTRNDAVLQELDILKEVFASSDHYTVDDKADTQGSTASSSEELDYLCARFVSTLKEEHSEYFERLSDIAWASVVSEVVLDLRAPPEAKKIASDLSVYLDGPFCMDILGLTGNARKDNANYIYEKLIQMQVKLYVFSHSLEEIRENLHAVLRRQPYERVGPTGDAIRRGEVLEDFAIAVQKDPENFIVEKGIRIFDSRIVLPVTQTKYFDDETANLFLASLSPGWSNETARNRDANSMKVIMGKREGHRSRDVFRCRHVMITHNPALARKSAEFCRVEALYDSNYTPPIVHQRRIAALLWLTVGSAEKMEISRRQLVLNCANAIRTRPGVVGAMRSTLSRVNPDVREQFDAILTQPRAMQLAMDLTLSDASVVDDSNIEEIYEIVRQSTVQEERERHDGLVSNLRSNHRAELDSRDQSIKGLSDRSDSQRREIRHLMDSDIRTIENWVARCASSIDRRFVLVRILVSIAMALILLSPALGWIELFGSTLNWLLGGVTTVLALSQIWSKPNWLIKLNHRFKDRALHKRIREAQKEEVIRYADVDWGSQTVNWYGKYAHDENRSDGQLL